MEIHCRCHAGAVNIKSVTLKTINYVPTNLNPGEAVPGEWRAFCWV